MHGNTQYYRLIALWVFCEAMLGGIIHGLRIPVSGLLVGSCAVVCICLIAWYAPAKGAIIKATLIVAIFKMMLSPQAPPPAYFAVFFQGVLGELLFWNRRLYPVSCVVLALLSLLESGLQRILVLTIVYGNDLWKVINDFISGLSLLIIGGYLFLHVVAGLLVGWWAAALPKRIAVWNAGDKYRITANMNVDLSLPSPANRRKLKKGLFVIWILLIGLYVQSYFSIGKPLLPSHISLKILLRSLIIVLGWIFIIGPLLKHLLHAWLRKKQSGSQQDVQEVLRLLPSMQQLVTKCWKQSAGNKGLKRISYCSKMVLVNALASSPPQAEDKKTDIYILTGPIRSGKTSSLIDWAEKRKDVYGILTPVVNERRVFLNVFAKETFPMEASKVETEIFTVGRFKFSKFYFDKAIQIIDEGFEKGEWLLIDEIGPLELEDKGFAGVVKKILNQQRNGKLIFVVREGFVEKVRSFFGMDAIVIHSPAQLTA